ncbi:MAG: zinc-binding dehydrogenase [Gammaproteobacteria bacterium]|nr:zinc-binding dehydrogenase [Gammaproteobacteria bacterium]
MKALVLHEANTPFDLTEVPDPVAGPGEAVARVYACGSGLTIQHFKAGRVPAVFPRIIGHEICAEIVEVGADVEGLEVGDIVTSYFYMYCGHCKQCRANFQPLCENLGGFVGREIDGGYAEYIKLPERWFIKLPNGLDWRNQPAHVGVAMDALATPYKVLRRARIEAEDTVAVLGAGGGLGLHQILMARWAGARVIAVDTKATKFDACREAGADEVVDASENDVVEALMDLTDGNGVEVCVDYVSTKSTLEAGVRSLGKHGRLVTLGGAGETFSVDAAHLLNNEIDILGSRYVSPAEILETYDFMVRGEVWPIVTEIRPMEEAEIVHDLVERGEVTGRAALLIG